MARERGRCARPAFSLSAFTLFFFFLKKSRGARRHLSCTRGIASRTGVSQAPHARTTRSLGFAHEIRIDHRIHASSSFRMARARITSRALWWLALLLCAVGTVHGNSIHRVRRQDVTPGTPVPVPISSDSLDKDLCEGRSPGEYFRLTADDDCRDVVRCSVQGLLALRCPAGLAFDIEKQTCDWKDHVKNCERKQKSKKVQPLLSTTEPLCEEEKLACGNGDCLDKALFCDGKPDCTDESDENACGMDEDPNRAPPCDTQQCTLPDCFCSVDGSRIPGDLEPTNVPQMIMISFDDAININNIDLYEELFNGERKNPNGCTIKGTFFISHKYTNYSAVQEMHRLGHEIATHSITHKNDETYWTEASVDEWAQEMAGSRLITEKFANITDNSVIGVRAPFLRVGGNNQFAMMEEQGFLWDSSMTVPLGNPPLWPYTLYFRMPHKCHGNGQKCPSRSHAVWEIVMNELDRRDDPTFDEDLPGCAMVDSCSNLVSGEQFYNFLNHNFKRHYEANRAPLGLFFHAVWLKNNPELKNAFIEWLDEIMANHKDVYLVTMTQVIQWIQSPTDINGAKDFSEWKSVCIPEGQPHCSLPNACPLSTKELPGETLRLHTCMPCPNNYPWLDDPTGEGFFK